MSIILQAIQAKIQSQEQAQNSVADWQRINKKVVFTNGCFDLLHLGHLHYLAMSKTLGDYLVIGLNSAESVRRLKGQHRPINDSDTRRFMLAALSFVDLVVEFAEDTPLQLIQRLQPDVLVKGGDYELSQIVGADVVRAKGGRVLTLPFVEGYSTTQIEQRIKML